MTVCSPLPQPMDKATVVPYDDSFLLVGGRTNLTGNAYLSTIYHYKPDDHWNTLDARLKEGKYGVIAMLVGREMLEIT
jgi:hypothetical protein